MLLHLYTVFDRMYVFPPAGITVCTPHIREHVWFWPTVIVTLAI